jgi:hypothetical protein
METVANFIFLLGGHDLEMLEIKKILEQKHITFYDFNLALDAKLSSYKKVFDDSHNFVGVELIRDIEPPVYYKEIDHYNKNSNHPSSLEQIADLFNVSITRYRKLVVINDLDNIAGLLANGATKNEINKIRKNDRASQGISEMEEELAEKSIRENSSIEKGILVVKSPSSEFSPIIDRLYTYKRVLVYSDETLTYYGSRAGDLVKAFPNFIKEKKAYHLAGVDGIFKLAENAFFPGELYQIRKKIISIISSEYKT